LQSQRKSESLIDTDLQLRPDIAQSAADDRLLDRSQFV
jgi:hypothetical protein